MRNYLGPVFLLLLVGAVCGALIIVPSSCGSSVNCADPVHALDATCVVGNILIECAGSDVAGAITQYTPTVEDIIARGVQADGSINYALIEGDLIAAVAKYGWCVVSSVFNHYINPTPPSTGSNSAVVVTSEQGIPHKHPTPRAALDAFNRLRTKMFPKGRFHTAGGVL